MDGLQPGNSLKGDASGGKMSLDDAVRAAVRSSTEFGGTSETPAREIEAPAESGDDHDDGQDHDAAPSSDAKGTEKSDTSDGSDAGRAATDEVTLAAPKAWPRAQREAFDKAPDEVKKLLLEREKAHNVTFTRLAQSKSPEDFKKLLNERVNFENLSREQVQQVNADREFAGQIRSLFTPETRQTMQANGLKEVDALKRLVSFHDRLTTDPIREIRELAGRLKISPAQLFPGQNGQPAPSAADPATQEVQPSADSEVMREIAGIKKALLSAHHQDQNQRFMTFEQEVNTFEADADEAGNPKHPHFEAVFDQMMIVLQNDPEIAAVKATQPRKALEAAYEKAVYLNPETRQAVIDAEFAKRSQSQQVPNAQARQAAEKAKAAATRKGTAGAGGSSPVPAKMTLDAAVKAAAASLKTR